MDKGLSLMFLNPGTTFEVEARFASRREREQKRLRQAHGEHISSARLHASKTALVFQGIQTLVDESKASTGKVPRALQDKWDRAFEIMSNAQDDLDALLR